MRTLAASSLLAASLTWVAALLSAPLSHDLLSAATYLAGGFVCHQRPDRSFQVAGRPMPVCARCTGVYAAAPVGALAAVLTTRKRRARAGRRAARLPASRVRNVVLAAAVPTAATLTAEWLGFARPSGAARALAAAPLGAAAAWIVTRAIRTE